MKFDGIEKMDPKKIQENILELLIEHQVRKLLFIQEEIKYLENRKSETIHK